MADYLRYWAKTGMEGNEPSCHLLPYHGLDVAAVGQVLLACDTERTNRLCERLQLDYETGALFVVFSLALHDIGKFARAFQNLARPEGIDVVPPAPRISYDPNFRHDALGSHLWERVLWPTLRDQGVFGTSASSADRMRLKKGLDLWFSPFFGHHGRPVAAGRAPVETWFREPEDSAAALQYLRAVEHLLAVDWLTTPLADRSWQKQVLAAATWELAGLAVICDWLGSNQSYFAHVSEAMPLHTYWTDYALPRAENAVAASGLINHPDVAPFPGFRKAFEFAPTPLQSWAEQVALADTPQLFILEDLTGAGKTEAALSLSHRLMAAGHAQGLYFGLPTMATSNAMYQRIGRLYQRFFTGGGNASLVLAHGSRHLNETFAASVNLSADAEENAYADHEPSASISCNAWIGDNRKRALLADVGVGTIDQALLGILPRRHQSVRLLGLRDKVLIVDEIHAYDAYTTALLEQLLEAHAGHGGSAILLSATIPHRMRSGLLAAWRRGRAHAGNDVSPHDEAPFPLATHQTDTGTEKTPVAHRTASARSIDVRWLADTAGALDRLLTAARAGHCACWIRNTVDDAIHGFRMLREHADDTVEVLLFHARFAMCDRQRIEDQALQRFGSTSGSAERTGQILIATQVVEQSLDVDFDVLVTDLAPIDLLIQRAGRLHRHRRDANGDRLTDTEATEDGRTPPSLDIVAPPWNDDPGADWVSRHLPGTGYVYNDHAVLWLTCRVLRQLGGIHLPERARELLEAVYGEDAAVAPGLEPNQGESYAEERARRSVAEFTALDLSRGYTLESSNGGWDGDQEAGTRLGDEPTIAVALLDVDDTGRPKPWCSDSPFPWAMSTVNLRQNLARRIPSLPESWSPTIEAWRAQKRSLQYTEFWAVNQSPADSLEYDRETGVARSTADGCDQ